MSIAFEGEASFFDHLADGARNPMDQVELHRLAQKYRSLESTARRLPAKKLSRTDALRFRAEECRTLAEQFRNEECRKYLKGLARTYDHLAESSETTDYLHSFEETDLFRYD